MGYDIRRGAPLDLRDRRMIGALAAWCTGLAAILYVVVVGLPPGSAGNVACAILAIVSFLIATFMLLQARSTVRLRDRPGEVLDDGDALAMVIDLGVDPLAPWIVLYLGGLLLLGAEVGRFVPGHHLGQALLGGAIGHALLCAQLVRWLGPTVARADGLGLKIARGGWVRSIAWAELREVSLRRGDLVLVRLDGKRRRLRSARLAEETRGRLRARIEAGIAAAAGPPPSRAELLARQGRTLKEWRRALSRLVVDEGYRERGLSPDEAEAVLAAQRAPAEQRVGAAFALAASGGPLAGERIRGAASTCPDRRLRAALLETLVDEPHEATVERALPPKS